MRRGATVLVRAPASPGRLGEPPERSTVPTGDATVRGDAATAATGQVRRTAVLSA
ncbi:hypothetical protein AB0O07_04635 [Streptomyces sp. NPDC093085]|uniref:hypothetical protein n=1 Tax=Streptomyces sp. NPDC093085 TaxID=3155068 RepID=UPI0034410033